MTMTGTVTQARLFALGLILLAGQLAFGQTFGSIGGETRDSTGAIVAGAAVTAVNVGTNATRTVVTNDAGAYAFPSLPPGTYTVKVEKAGFKTVVRNQIELQVQLAARVDFELQVGTSQRIRGSARRRRPAGHRQRHRRHGDREQAHRGTAR